MNVRKQSLGVLMLSPTVDSKSVHLTSSIKRADQTQYDPMIIKCSHHGRGARQPNSIRKANDIVTLKITEH